MPSFHVISRSPHQILFFGLKDKNYKKAKMKGGLGWMKNIGNGPARFLMGTIFLVYLHTVKYRVSARSLGRSATYPISSTLGAYTAS